VALVTHSSSQNCHLSLHKNQQGTNIKTLPDDSAAPIFYN
jgi:hypothetical protein